MININKVYLLGYAGQDAESVSVGGNTKATFSIATTKRWTDKSGEKKESTQWHRIVAWRQLAEWAASDITKGTPVLVIGSLQTRSFETQSGSTAYVTEVVAESIQAFAKLKRTGGGENPPSAHRPEEPLPF